jgi:hypothetical protein
VHEDHPHIKHSVRVPINAEEAAEVVASATQREGVRYEASRLGGTELWSVVGFEEGTNSPLIGSFAVVGPDHRLWQFSSNPAIHDPNLVVAALEALYREGVADLVEANLFAERITDATKTRLEQVSGIVKDATAGSLRRRTERRLP